MSKNASNSNTSILRRKYIIQIYFEEKDYIHLYIVYIYTSDKGEGGGKKGTEIKKKLIYLSLENYKSPQQSDFIILKHLYNCKILVETKKSNFSRLAVRFLK